MALTDIWFLLIAVLWTGYFVLEGFDFGVGMLLPLVGRTENDRRVAINTIGPVWDGNEVWLLVAGGATFAAFPEWYASLFSGFYLALLLILVALIVRGVAFEFRGKIDSDALAPQLGHRDHRRARRCPRCCGAWRSRTSCAACRSTPHHEYTGTLLTLLNPYALLGGLATLSLFALHGAVFLALKTPATCGCAPTRWSPGSAVPAIVLGGAFLVWTFFAHGVLWTGLPVLVAAGALVAAVLVAIGGPGGLGVPAHGAGHRRRHGDAVRIAVPERAALEHRTRPSA